MKRVLVVAITVAIVASVGTLALASHDFSDVPDTHPFHEEISSMAAAGITTGFGDGTFRGSSDVSRQAMAAFMQRGFGRMWFDGNVDSTGSIEDSLVSVIGTNNPVVPAATIIIGGAAGGGNGYALLEGNVLLEGGTGCPCGVIVEIIDFSGATLGFTVAIVDLGELKTVSLQGADVIPADAGDIFGIRATQFLGLAGDTVEYWADLSALYVPFDAFATNEFVVPPTPSIAADALTDAEFDLSDFPSMSADQLEEVEAIFFDSIQP